MCKNRCVCRFLIEPWKRHGATFPYSSGDFCTLPALRRIRSSLFRRFLTRIVSFFFLSTENDLHRNLRLNIGRDINRHNNRKRTELKNSRNARWELGNGTRCDTRDFGTRVRRLTDASIRRQEQRKSGDRTATANRRARKQAKRQRSAAREYYKRW